MEMFLKLFFLIMINCTHAEPLLNSLHGLNSRIPVTACSTSGAHCEGVVLLADWVAVLDSCIRAQSTEHIYVQTGIVNCTQVCIRCYSSQYRANIPVTHLEKTTLAMSPLTRVSSVPRVVERFSHPLAPSIDLALLRLEWPYVEEIGNATPSYNSLYILDTWMEGILYSNTENIDRDHTEIYTETEYHMYSSPLKMFFATVILPSASFILLFLFIIFFTGTSDDTRMIPYKTLNNDKDSSHV